MDEKKSKIDSQIRHHSQISKERNIKLYFLKCDRMIRDLLHYQISADIFVLLNKTI